MAKVVIAGAGGERFTFDVDCGNTDRTIELGNGETSTIGDLPVGTTCTVTERTPQNTASVTWTTTVTDTDGANDGVVVVHAGSDTVTFTNNRTAVLPQVLARTGIDPTKYLWASYLPVLLGMVFLLFSRRLKANALGGDLALGYVPSGRTERPPDLGATHGRYRRATRRRC